MTNSEKNNIPIKTPKTIRLRLFMILFMLVSFCVIYTVYIIKTTTPDPIPDEISRFLVSEGLAEAEHVDYEIVSYKSNYSIYRSSRPLIYQGRSTELWKVYHWSTMIKMYYYVVPYYENE